MTGMASTKKSSMTGINRTNKETRQELTWQINKHDKNQRTNEET